MADKTKTNEEGSVNRPRVFVYGTLKVGNGNHRALKDAKFLGRVRVIGPYSMVNLGWFPGVIENAQVKDGRIYGEVYEISDEILHTLDLIEGHPNFYNRRKIETPFKKAWCYFLPSPYLERCETVATGAWHPSDKEQEFIKLDVDYSMVK